MVRLDQALADRGLARSRTQASRLIAEGRVRVDGRPVIKASLPVAESSRLEVSGADAYVSRGAYKLIAALDAFAVPVQDRLALDMGASTGGFTQVLRERGARRVLAVDVGHGQLDPGIAADPGVTSIEGINVRDLTAQQVRELSGEPKLSELIVGDLSFISLRLVLPVIATITAAKGDVILLVKPQFEVGRTAVRGGIVSDPRLRADAVEQVLWSAWDQGLAMHGITASPILGTHGNAEFLVHLRSGDGLTPAEWMEQIAELTGA